MSCRDCPPVKSGHHCARCHRTFTGLGLFDKHQDRDYERTPRIVCIDPVSLGMVKAGNGAWSTPEGARKISTMAEMGRSRRKVA